MIRVDRQALAALHEREAARFLAMHARSAALAAEDAQHFLFGVPLHWMRDWPTPAVLHVERAQGNRLYCADGHEYLDFCLGDTGAMFGHSPAPVARAIAGQASRGLTAMLPSTLTAEVGQRLAHCFRLPRWQITLSASDANRFVLRWARAITGRPRVLVFDGCYHGTVDDTFVRLVDGVAANRPGLLGQVTDLTRLTRVVEFNDVPALAEALSHRDVACVVTEPVLTNSCMVLPKAGFHAELRRLTRDAGALLLIDETHTISTGRGGYTRAHGLEPDLFVLGKPIAGGVPASVWGFTDEVARRLTDVRHRMPAGHSGMGTTLSANGLSLAAMRATLEQVMTPEACEHMEALASRLSTGLREIITRHDLPWHVVRVGARVEFICAPGPLVNGTEAEAAHAPALEQALHLGLLNRGCLIAPFHNMMLVSPATSPTQVESLCDAFDAIAAALLAGNTLPES